MTERSDSMSDQEPNSEKHPGRPFSAEKINIPREKELDAATMTIDMNFLGYSGPMPEDILDQKKDLAFGVAVSQISKGLSRLGFAKQNGLYSIGSISDIYVRDNVVILLSGNKNRLTVSIVNPDEKILNEEYSLLRSIKMETEKTQKNPEEYRADLMSKETHEVIEAAKKCGELLVVENVPELTLVTDATNPLARRSAVTSLGRIHLEESQTKLVEKVFDPDEHVAWRAALEVAKYQNEAARDLMERLFDFYRERKIKGFTPEKRWIFGSLMFKIFPDPGMKDVLSQGLKSQNRVVKNLAIINLGRIKAFDDIQAFIRDPDPAIRESVIVALSGKMDNDNHAEAAFTATKELEAIKDEILNDPDEYIRKIGENIFTPHTEQKEAFDPQHYQNIKNGMLGVVIGDAFGAPFEFRKKDEILAEYGEHFDDYAVNKNRPVFPGQPTDDTEETLLLARSLALSNGFEPNQFARLLGKNTYEMDLGKRKNTGYGKNTIKATRYLYAGVNWRLIKDNFKTNGAAMRVFPLSAIIRNKEELKKAITACSHITHPQEEAVTGALIIGLAYYFLLNDKNLSNEELIEAIINEIPAANGQFGQKLIELQKLLPSLDSTTDDELAQKFGTSSQARESILYSLAIFAKHRHDPLQALNSAVIVDGDSDSTGAMVGCLLGLSGEKMPSKLVENFYGKKVVEHYATLLATL